MAAWLGCILLFVLAVSALSMFVFIQLAAEGEVEPGQAEHDSANPAVVVPCLLVVTIGLGVGYGLLERHRRRSQSEQPV